MLEIKKSNPWIFWPSSICDTLPEKPANKILSGEHYFKLKISGGIIAGMGMFILLENIETKVFSLLI